MKDIEKLISKLRNVLKSETEETIDEKIKEELFEEDFHIEDLQHYMYNVVPEIKNELFQSYQTYCISYLAQISIFLKHADKTDKRLAVYSCIYNIHQALELFFKSYKVFIENLYGYDKNSFKRLRTSTPKEMKTNVHKIDGWFQDKEIVFILETFGTDKRILKELDKRYQDIKITIGFDKPSEQARFPQGLRDFLPHIGKNLQDEDIERIYTNIQEIVKLITQVFFNQHNPENLKEENIKKVIKGLI